MSKTNRKEKEFKPKSKRPVHSLPPPKLGQFNVGNVSF